MAQDTDIQGDGIQGEGNYDAARRYRKGQEEFAKSGKVDKAAHEAEDALDGPEGAELERARRETGEGKTG
ncbi:MAG: hypothetical protein ACXWK7_16845 [Caulobacteraceae bacterium]